MSSQHSSSATEHFNKLIQFRQAGYAHFGAARDALFELTDAVIQMRQAHSFAELSCAPAFRRKWSSAYEALQDGRPDRSGLMRLYLDQFEPQEPLILAGDHTAWPRLWAETLPGRSYQHQPSPIAGRRPVTIGLGYSTLALIPEKQGSWALPLLHERISQRTPGEQAAEQLRQVCQGLAVRPITLWDSEYGTGAFLRLTKSVRADKIIRLRGNLCLEGPTKPWKGRGRRPVHGVKFHFQKPETWWQPDQVLEYTDPEFGPVTVRVWNGLRFRTALDCPMQVAQVERTQAPGTRRKPRLLWFAWVGEEPPEQWWRLYTRRYPVDHWYRFAKNRLHWLLPKPASLEQGDRWSDLMPFLTWELWLAREVVEDCPLPWQKPQQQLSPGRVCLGLQNLFAVIGTPACACKSRGKAPGWPSGKARRHRERQELLISEPCKRNRERLKNQKAEKPAKRGRPPKAQPSPTA
jgi:hypothetical protein